MNQLFLFRDGHLAESPAPLNRGMLYGDGYFESMRWHKGRILLKNYHEERIEKSNRLLQFTSDDYKDLAVIEQTLNELPAEEHLRIRVLFIRKGTGFYMPDENKADVYVSIQSLDNYYQLNTKGLHCIRYMHQPKAAGKYSVIKSTSALLYVMASLEIKKSGADEAIIMNTNGRLAEGSSTNVFIYKGNTILTPSLEEGCVDGVFRKFLIDTALKKEYKVKETAITVDDLESAEELWFTSGIRGLLWARSCEGKVYKNNVATELHHQLMNELI